MCQSSHVSCLFSCFLLSYLQSRICSRAHLHPIPKLPYFSKCHSEKTDRHVYLIVSLARADFILPSFGELGRDEKSPVPATYQLCHQASVPSWKSHPLLDLISSPVKGGGGRFFTFLLVSNFQGSARGELLAPKEPLPAATWDLDSFSKLFTSLGSGLHPQLWAPIKASQAAAEATVASSLEGEEICFIVTHGNVSSSPKELPVINAKQHKGPLLSW